MKARKYANPSSRPAPGRGNRYVPTGGMKIGGEFYQGGEHLDPTHDLPEGVATPELLAQLNNYLHADREQALRDYTTFGRFAPTKDSASHILFGAEPKLPYADERLEYTGPTDKRGRGYGPRFKTPEAARAAIPGDQGRHLSDAEALGLTPSQVQQFVEVFNQSAPVHELATAAALGKHKRTWYQDAARAIVTVFGPDAPRFGYLLAATSPQKPVDRNLANALAVWRRWNDFQADLLEREGRAPTRKDVVAWLRSGVKDKDANGDPIPPKPGTLAALLEEDGAYIMPGEINNITRALLKPLVANESGQYPAGILSGPKVDAFGGASLGDLERVVNDVWQGVVANVPQAPTFEGAGGKGTMDEYGSRGLTSGGYAAIAAKTRAAAELLNQHLEAGERPWTPAEVQAAAWSLVKTLSESMGQKRAMDIPEGSPEEKARQTPDPIEALNSLTNQQVADTPDFAGLLVKANADPASPIRTLVKSLGLETHLARLARQHAKETRGREAVAGRAIENVGSLGAAGQRSAERIARRAGQVSPQGGWVGGSELADEPPRPRRGKGKKSKKARKYAREMRTSLRQRRKYAADPTTDSALVATSSNTDPDMSFDEALRKIQSGDHQVFKKITDQMAQQVGLHGKSYHAVGDWEDGAEQSVINEIPEPVDMDTLRYVGAWYGLMGNQRAVLVFKPEPHGLDSVYQVQVPETDISKVRARLSQYGIPYRTIVPGKKGTRVVVYDQKRALRDQISQFASAYHAPVRESIGTGEFVGGGSRAEARKTYRDVIAGYEEANRGRRPLHKGQASGVHRGRGAQAQEGQTKGLVA